MLSIQKLLKQFRRDGKFAKISPEQPENILNKKEVPVYAVVTAIVTTVVTAVAEPVAEPDAEPDAEQDKVPDAEQDEVPVATPVVAEPQVAEEDGEENKNWRKVFKSELVIMSGFFLIGTGAIVVTGGGALGFILSFSVMYIGIAFLGGPIARPFSKWYHSV